jgi:hypothetical protein
VGGGGGGGGCGGGGGGAGLRDMQSFALVVICPSSTAS